MAATVASIKVLKQSPFKGGLRVWSNRYHFTGGTPADATHWHTLMDAVVAAEKLALRSDSTIIECIGYAAGSDVAVASKTYTQAGSVGATATAFTAPGEVAALVRWATGARTTKNHPIYLFSYFHNINVKGSRADSDLLDTTMNTALATYATAWVTGFSDGTITAKRSGPQGHTATGSIVEEFLTHRDFPYTPSL